MELKQESRNDLFKRHEMIFEITADKNPSFSDCRSLISKEVGKPEENIDVFSIKGNFGNNDFTVVANVYDSKQDLEKAVLLRKTKKQRDAEKKAEEEAKKKAAESAANPQ